MIGAPKIQEDPLRIPIPGESTPIDVQDYQDSAGSRLSSTWGQSISASFERSLKDTPLNSLIRKLQLNSRNEGGPKLSPQELNQLFPDMDRPFEGPLTRDAAEYIAEQARERRNLEYLIERGPQGILPGFSRFAAGVAPHMLDPLNLAASYVAGGLFAGARALGLGAELLSSRSASSVLLRDVAEGVIGNAATEPLTYSQANAEQQDYGVDGSIKNVVIGAVTFPAVKYVGGKVFRFLRGSPRAEGVIERSALGQLASDRRVDVNPLIRDQIREVNGSVRSGASEITHYIYSPLKAGEDAGARRYFVGSPSGVGDFRTTGKPVIENDFGQGVYLTDNPVVANGYASRKLLESQGQIFEVGIPKGAKLIDLEERLPPEVAKTLESPLREVAGDSAAEILAKNKGKDVLDLLRTAIDEGALSDDSFNKINAQLHAQGFDGYRSEGGTYLGEEGKPHNVVQLFDPENTGDASGRARALSQVEPNADLVARVEPSEARDIARAHQGISYDALLDQADYAAHQKTQRGEFEILSKPTDMEQRAQAVVEDLKALAKQEALGPDDLREFEKLTEFDQDMKRREQITRAAAICVGRIE